MCGIAFTIGDNLERSKDFVLRANQLMKHRGPDGEGVFQDEYVAMAHRRLAILDLSEAGAQPMYTHDKRYVIVHNGEVYNHLALRAHFLPNYDFKGHSDTETILALYIQLGHKMLEHLVGMWAFAIWDTVNKSLFISRDRFGQKPLYWRKSSKGDLLFSSEIKPLLSEAESPKMNPLAVVEYLALGNYGHLGTQTFFKDIYHFPQGHYSFIQYGDQALSTQPYWTLPFVNQKDKVAFDHVKKEELRNVVSEAVSSQLLADVTIGATLSGGIDSSVTVGLMAKYAKKAFPVFTAQTSGSKYDESQYVKAVELKWGKSIIHLHWKELLNTKLSESLPQYIQIQEEPFGDPSIMAHGFLMDMAKEQGIKVVVGGQGSDELFFGYKNMTMSLLSQGLRAGEISWFMDNVKKYQLSKGEKMRIVLSALLPGLETYLRKRSRTKRRMFLHPNLLNQIKNVETELPKYSNFYDVWKESVYGIHLPHLVHYDDRNGMSRSLEGRMPFLDHRIAECIATVKSKDLFRSGKAKSVLRDACEEVIPQEVLNRRDKIGFYTPLPTMMESEKEYIDQFILQYLPKDLILEKYWPYINDKSNYLLKFRVLSLAVWIKEFNVQ